MLPENNKKTNVEGNDDKKKPTDAEIISQGAAGGGNIIAAHEQAEEDIEQDPDFSSPTPNDDLDEGETARLGGDKNDLV